MKPVLAVLVLLVSAASVCRGQTASIAIVHHNIHSGGQAKASADHIETLLNLTPQKVLVLCNEANYSRQYFTLPYTGWHHIWPNNSFEGRGNPTFIRDAVATVMSTWAETMTEAWTYNGNDREPRVFTVAKCQLVASPWVQFHCVNVHFTPYNSDNVAARQEQIRRLIQLSTDMPLLPLIICGDFNMEETEAKTRIADQVGGKLYSNAKVDHIILRDGQDVGFTNGTTVTRLGQYISDHTALRYNLTFQQLTSGVADWTLY